MSIELILPFVFYVIGLLGGILFHITWVKSNGKWL